MIKKGQQWSDIYFLRSNMINPTDFKKGEIPTYNTFQNFDTTVCIKPTNDRIQLETIVDRPYPTKPNLTWNWVVCVLLGS
jgi:hypothetical protein